MQTRTYGDLFRSTTALIGTGGKLDVNEQEQLHAFINRRFQQAFDESPIWPRYLVTAEERDIISIQISGVTGTDATEVNSSYSFLGTVESTYSGTVLNKSTKVYLSKNSATVPTVGNTDITSATIIYQQMKQGSSDDIRWIVRTGATVSYDIGTDGAVNITEVASGNIRLKETTGITASNPTEVISWVTVGSTDGVPVFTSKQLIPYVQSYSVLTNASASIGGYNRIHRKKPFLNQSAVEYEFFVDFDGANILNIQNSEDSTAFVSYKKQFTPFSVSADFYNSTVEVPLEFFNFIVHAVYADFLRVQNRQQESILEEELAQNYLTLELEKISIRSNNNTLNKKFSTHLGRQSR